MLQLAFHRRQLARGIETEMDEYMRSHSWIIFCLMLLTACAQSPLRTQAQSPAEPGNVNMLMKFAQSYSALPAEAQKREYGQINARRKGEYSRMQMVMMAVLPGSRYKDDARAMALLDEHLKAPDSRDEGLRTLAGVIKALLAAPPKQEENVAQLMQKLKDEQKRADMLQHKLDELLAVEKTMYDRHEAQPK